MSSKNTKLDVATALQSPEDDVKKPSARRSSSFAAQIEDLQVGQVAITAQPLSLDMQIGLAMTELAERKQVLRNSVAPAVTKMKKRWPGREYTVETAELATAAAGWMVVAVVKRVA
jgi:hypothetical protein